MKTQDSRWFSSDNTLATSRFFTDLFIVVVGENGTRRRTARAAVHGEVRSVVGGELASELHEVGGRTAMEHGASVDFLSILSTRGLRCISRSIGLVQKAEKNFF